jgi:hypothetical protein
MREPIPSLAKHLVQMPFDRAAAGFPSYGYVRVGNCGTDSAADPSVKLYTADPASGLEWPRRMDARGYARARGGRIDRLWGLSPPESGDPYLVEHAG